MPLVEVGGIEPPSGIHQLLSSVYHRRLPSYMATVRPFRLGDSTHDRFIETNQVGGLCVLGNASNSYDPAVGLNLVRAARI